MYLIKFIKESKGEQMALSVKLRTEDFNSYFP